MLWHACSCGSQALVCTHEAATAEEVEPYLSWRLRPLRPMLMFGRCFKQSPPCPKSQSLAYFWEDPHKQSKDFYRDCLASVFLQGSWVGVS